MDLSRVRESKFICQNARAHSIIRLHFFIFLMIKKKVNHRRHNRQASAFRQRPFICVSYIIIHHHRRRRHLHHQIRIIIKKGKRLRSGPTFEQPKFPPSFIIF